MSRFLVHFHGDFGSLLHDQVIQERKSIIIFNLYCELDGRPKAVEVKKKLLQLCWSMWLNHKSVANIFGVRRQKTNSIYWAQLSKFHMETEAESSLQNDVF
jgi:hypothetical protein